MIMLLFGITIILSILNLIQYKAKKDDQKKLRYIYTNLNTIITNNTSQKLLLVTDNKDLKYLLIAINRLLVFNQQIVTGKKKKEISMKKMLVNISHDLKTPLTVVLGYIETMLEDVNFRSQERHKLAKVHQKAVEILDLMNNFFDLAKIESGDKDFLLTRVNMNEICRNNILFFYEKILLEKFKVAIDIPDYQLYSLGNEEALDRILKNLISNAIKYGQEGEIIGITLRSDDSSIYVDVWDRGKGISERYKNCVFERLYTLEESRNKLYQGSGLGLTITKRLVEKLGGEVFLDSKPHKKTTFTVKLNRVN